VDVLSRARFDGETGRCIGMVPRETYYRNGPPEVVAPLTADELHAVQRGDMTREEAEEQARDRAEFEEHGYIEGGFEDGFAVVDYDVEDDEPGGMLPRRPADVEPAPEPRRLTDAQLDELVELRAEKRALELVEAKTSAEAEAIEAALPGQYEEPDDDDDPEGFQDWSAAELVEWALEDVLENTVEDLKPGVRDPLEIALFKWASDVAGEPGLTEHALTLEIIEETNDVFTRYGLRPISKMTDEGECEGECLARRSTRPAYFKNGAEPVEEVERVDEPEMSDGIEWGDDGERVLVDLDGDGDIDAVIEEEALGLAGGFRVVLGTVTMGASELLFFGGNDDTDEPDTEAVEAEDQADDQADDDAEAEETEPTRRAA